MCDVYACVYACVCMYVRITIFIHMYTIIKNLDTKYPSTARHLYFLLLFFKLFYNIVFHTIISIKHFYTALWLNVISNL